MVRIFGNILFIFLCIGLNAQSKTAATQKNTDADTLVLPPVTLLVSAPCHEGVTILQIETAEADSFTSPEWLYLYARTTMPDSTSSFNNTALKEVLSFTKLKEKQYRVVIEDPGFYTARTAIKTINGLKYGPYGNIIEVKTCSFISFPDVFSRSVQKVFAPLTLQNVTIIEFDIFDRIGNPVYSAKSNTVAWSGNYPNNQPCPAGVYYYSCSYIDLTADNGQKQTVSGMIELKD